MPKWARAVVAIVCLGASAHLIVMNRANFSGVFSEAPFDTSFPLMGGPPQITTDSESSPYTPGSPMLRALTEDRAFFYCYESLQTWRTATTDQSRVFAEGPTKVDSRFTPNRIDFNFAAREHPTRVYLNYNWSPGWTSTAGPIDAASREAMGWVVMQPGQSGTYSFSFIPPGLLAGTMIFVVAIAVSALVCRKTTVGGEALAVPRHFPARRRPTGSWRPWSRASGPAS